MTFFPKAKKTKFLAKEAQILREKNNYIKKSYRLGLLIKIFLYKEIFFVLSTFVQEVLYVQEVVTHFI